MKLDKNKLLQALERVNVHTLVESKILQKFIALEENNIAVIKSKDLKEQLDVSHTAIYSSLKNLQLKGFITKIKTLRDSYELNEKKLASIIDIYEKSRE